MDKEAMDLSVKYMLVKTYQQFQEERLQTHRIFDEAHKIYLSSGPEYDFDQFRKLVTDVTEDFKRIASEIADIESKLRTEDDVIEIADIIKITEANEKKKLELAARLQLAKQDKQDFPGKENIENTIQNLTDQLENLLSELKDSEKKVASLCAEILPRERL